MAKLPEDTTRDTDSLGADLQGPIPTLPNTPGPDNSGRHSPTTIGVPRHPVFAPNPHFLAAPDHSEAITTKVPAITAAYSQPSGGKPVIAPLPKVDLTDPLYTDYLGDENAPRPTAFQQLRYAIAKKDPYAMDALSLSEFSTIFTAIFEKRQRKELSREEAEMLVEEYFETLPEKDAGSVFMDIVVAEDRDLITTEEAAIFSKKLNLPDGDLAVFGELYTKLTGETVLPLKRPSSRKARIDDTPTPEGNSSISRFFSKRVALLAGAVLALGTILGLQNKFGKSEIELPSAPKVSPVIPPSPEAIKDETRQAVFVKKEAPLPAPKVIAPVVEKKATPAPEKAPTPAPAVVPPQKEVVTSAENPTPVMKMSKSGKSYMDEAASIEAWEKLGYSININSAGTIFTLTNKEGKKFVIDTKKL